MMLKRISLIAVCLVSFACDEPVPTVQSVAAQPAPAQLPKTKKRPATLKSTDVGVLSKFDKDVRLQTPKWLDLSTALNVKIGEDQFRLIGGTAVSTSPDAELSIASKSDDDLDGDGIPNQLDILIGAKKADLNHAPYGSPYRKLDFPNGDVPLTEGVCTDVIIRALRNAGIDLQKELNSDIKRSPKSFKMVKRADPNIDQRRVKTLLPYFKRHWVGLPTEFDGHEQTWFPGDIVFMQTMGDSRPDHVGIVSDRIGESGKPVIINNWTNGYHTDELDLLDWVPVTHRFRWKSTAKLPISVRGVDGILKSSGLTLPAQTEQLVVADAPGGESPHGTLRVVERRADKWKTIFGPIPVTFGANGMGRGRGTHKGDVLIADSLKKEGDKKSPWGVFKLGLAFGTRSKVKTKLEYRKVSPGDVWVDDPSSKAYNTLQTERGDWKSAEDLTQYRLALEVQHNVDGKPNAGSAIFIHSWKDLSAPTLGCTAMTDKQMSKLLRVLDPSKNPVLLQVPMMWTP